MLLTRDCKRKSLRMMVTLLPTRLTSLRRFSIVLLTLMRKNLVHLQLRLTCRRKSLRTMVTLLPMLLTSLKKSLTALLMLMLKKLHALLMLMLKKLHALLMLMLKKHALSLLKILSLTYCTGTSLLTAVESKYPWMLTSPALTSKV